jgi:hypothetical protein
MNKITPFLYASAFIANIPLIPSLTLDVVDGAKKTIKHQRELKQMTQCFSDVRFQFYFYISVVVFCTLVHIFYSINFIYDTIFMHPVSSLFPLFYLVIFIFLTFIWTILACHFYDHRILIDVVAVLFLNALGNIF